MSTPTGTNTMAIATSSSKSFWEEVLDAFDADVVGTDAATRNRVVVGVVAAAAAVAVGVALWTGSSRRPQGQSSRSSKGVPVTFNLDGASKSWLAKNMVTHGFADISRAARMAIDYVAQEGVPADVFASARVAAKTSRLEAGDVELVLDRAQLDWLERMVTDHNLTDRNHALAVAFDFAQRADSALIFRIDRSKTRGPRNPSVRFTIKS